MRERQCWDSVFQSASGICGCTVETVVPHPQTSVTEQSQRLLSEGINALEAQAAEEGCKELSLNCNSFPFLNWSLASLNF